MGASENLGYLRKVMGNLTKEEEGQINDWEKTIKKKNGYKKLLENASFLDFIEEIKKQYTAAVEKINDRETSDEERKTLFVIRDCWGFVMSLFYEADILVDQLNKNILDKATEFEKYHQK